jgi:hypothetical protein
VARAPTDCDSLYVTGFGAPCSTAITHSLEMLQEEVIVLSVEKIRLCVYMASHALPSCLW